MWESKGGGGKNQCQKCFIERHIWRKTQGVFHLLVHKIKILKWMPLWAYQTKWDLEVFIYIKFFKGVWDKHHLWIMLSL